jgi:polyisoprenoid-binding protein YceI
MTQLDTRAATRIIDDRVVPEPGTYEVDPSHSSVEFLARHLMITKVRGRFTGFKGNIVVAEEPVSSSVDVEIDASSIDTGDAKRDEHLRSADFLDVANYPTMTFRSTGVKPAGDRWKVTGDLTIRGVTRPVTLDVEFDGASVDPWGNQRIGVSARGEVDREEWGLTWNVALETGGVLVSRKIVIELAAEAVRQG